jgi:hypothetical protein
VKSEERLNAQEFLGVVSTRLAHRLSNYVSVVAGNLAIYDSAEATPAQQEAALAGIREAMHQAGELLDRFSDLARSLPQSRNDCPLPKLLENLSEWTAARADRMIQIAPQLSTWTGYALVGPWKWLAFALDAIAREATRLTLKVDPCAKPVGPLLTAETPKAYVALTIETSGTESINWHEHREGLKSWSLTAAYELLQYLGARPVTQMLPSREQQTRLILPLVEQAQSDSIAGPAV